MSKPLPTRRDWDINLIQVRRGCFVHLDDIKTAAEGQAILDELDVSILSVESHLANGDATSRDWRRKAEFALKCKRLQRPRLQERIGALKAAERFAPRPAGSGPSKRDAKRKAFIDAAEQLLPHESFTEIWARAAELDPQAFATSEAQA